MVAARVSYSYDAFGQLTSLSETFGCTTTWTYPYRYDGRDGVRFDGESGMYWLSVRAYDPIPRSVDYAYTATSFSAFANSTSAVSASVAFGSG
ncbi:MAG TPA: hypothetical protein VF040_06775 [Ktedonobacterales bacterium]